MSDEIKVITDSLNSLLGAAALAGATFAANWVRKVVGTWLNYLHTKMARWEEKHPEAQLEKAIGVAATVLRTAWIEKYGSVAAIPEEKRGLLIQAAAELVARAVPGASLKKTMIIAELLKDKD
jgi:hypothetical protein